MVPALGLDYGHAKIGLALAVGPLAEPLSTVPTSKILTLLPQLISQHNITTLVIGLPDGPVNKEIHTFVSNLQDIPSLSKIKIILQDETLSTQDAQNALMHSTPKRRKTREDSVAAAIILQSWLDSIPSGL
jgi:putative transcription antitermination factor YqgF